MTLRARLFATIVAVVLVSTVLTVGISELLLHHRSDAQAMQTLQSDAAVAAASPMRAAGAGPKPRATRHALRNSGALGSVFSMRESGSLPGLRPLVPARAAAVLAAIPSTPTASGHVRIGGHELLYAARTGSFGRIVLVRPARLGPGDGPTFAFSIVIVGLIGVLVAALIAWWLARRWTAPLRELAKASSELPRRHEPPAISRPSSAPQEILTLVDTFNEMSRELVAARGAQRDFLLAASHELKSPISAICGYAEGIHDHAVPPDEAASVILTEARRLQRLVRDLLDLARLDRREFDVVREPVKLSALATTVLERYATRCEELGVALLVLGAEAEPIVWGDRGRLLQATSNLVENALRVTPRGAAVELELASGMLAVCDRGPGLEAEELDRAFERFYLHRRHSDSSNDGAGLGLAIVSELMNAMGGHARAEARPGGGMRFSLLLDPVSADGEGTAARAAVDAAPAP